MSDTETEIKKLSVWNYFEKCIGETYKAKCLLCHKVLSCSTSHNLKHHLRRVHSDEVDVNNHLISRTRNKLLNEFDEYGSVSTRELINKAFTKVEGDKLAMCNICDKMLSYRSTICNLKHHIKSVHRDEYIQLLAIKDEDDEEATYFEVVEDDEVSAFFNRESGSRDIKNNKRKHEVEDGGADEDYTEVVYLEKEEDQMPCHNKYPKTVFPIESIKSLNDTSENNSLYEYDRDMRIERRTANDELDKFGQYVASLLASLPKHTCTRMQRNIVNLIIEEKLKIETKNDKTTVDQEKQSKADNNNEQVKSAMYNSNANEVSNTAQEHNNKYPKYLITENAGIVKN